MSDHLNRIDKVVAALQQAERKALVPYLPIGYPTPDHSLDLLHSLVDAGADMIELGVPFSDPMADGPVIQQATEIALRKGTTLKKVLDIAEAFRSTNNSTPLIMMTYANPIEAMGIDAFLVRAHAAGLDAVLLVDVPPEEMSDFKQKFNDAGLHLIHFIAPTTTSERVSLLRERAQGFVYYVALKGVTGAATIDTDAVGQHVREVAKVLQIPVFVGFGIHDGESAKAIAQAADGVIVGTALVRQITAAIDQPATEIIKNVKKFVQSLRVALDSP